MLFRSQTTVIRFPTNIASIVGRWACGGDDDLPAVHALQDATTLTVVDSTGNSAGLPVPEPGVSQDLLFLEKLRIWSQAFPPAPRDRELQDSFSPIGIDEPGASPYSSHSAASLSADEAAALADGLTIGEKNLLEALTKGSSPEVNGWKLTFHAFDYNLDYFEVGTIDDPQFKIADPKLRIVERAAAAKGGLWGNHPYEAAYIMTYVDDQGEQLNGNQTYTIRLDPTPPVSAFWSLTMYSVPDFFLGAVLLIVFALDFGWFPINGGGTHFWDRMYHIVLPALTLAFLKSAFMGKLTRTSLLEVLGPEARRFVEDRVSEDDDG